MISKSKDILLLSIIETEAEPQGRSQWTGSPPFHWFKFYHLNPLKVLENLPNLSVASFGLSPKAREEARESI